MIHNLAQGEQVFTSNAYLVTGERNVVVDPGNDFDIVSKIKSHIGDDLDAVVLTHTHSDHVGNLQDVKTAFGVDCWGYDTDQPGVDHEIEDEETVKLGDHEYVALHTPGHKNDHLCFHSETANVLIAGDLIFANGSFGRTDLEEGDRRLLIDSIDRVKNTVDEELEVMHTGHGPSVTNRPYNDVELASRAARMGA